MNLIAAGPSFHFTISGHSTLTTTAGTVELSCLFPEGIRIPNLDPEMVQICCFTSLFIVSDLREYFFEVLR